MKKRNKLNTKELVVVMDTETEGLNLVTSRPWEVAWLKYKNGEILDSQTRYLWWDDLNISAKAAEVTGFDRDKYEREAVDPVQVFEEIQPWFFNSLLCFHNGLNFDVYQIRNWFREIGQTTEFDWVRNVIDTNALAKAWKMEDEPPEENFDAWQQKWANFIKKGLKSNLAHLCEEFGIEVDKTRTHQGDYDCYLTAQVYKHLAYKFKKV